ncbi:MAG: hypothetical protein IPL53_25215 [Ignavibacteria bacterium]|nr:hypothetical protein [Ignavibacteria bacterium]
MKPDLKISTLIFLVCFLFQNSYSQQNLNGWFWSKGQPQTNELKWVKVIDPTHIYAVGSRGTFMKSSDGGDTWIINSQAGLPDNSFGEFGSRNLNSAWFFDANTGIVGGSQPYNSNNISILRTTNGGDNFSTISVASPIGFSSVTNFYFINSNTGYLCGNSITKAYKTTDAGLTWSPVPNVPSGFSFLSVYALDENNIFLGPDSEGLNRKVLKTTNAGATWSTITLPGTVPVSVLTIQFQNAYTGFIGGQNPYFETTTDGGSSWIQYALPSNQMSQFKIKVVGSTVYSLGSYTSIFKTTNLGATWDSVYYYDVSNANQMPPFLMYAMDINGNDMVVAGLDGRLNVSNDGGITWRNKNYSVGQYNYWSVYVQTGNGKVWAGGNNASVMYSPDGGTNWAFQRQNTNLDPINTIRAFSFVNSNTGYCVGGFQQHGTTAAYKTTNGGTNWNTMTLPNNYQQQAVEFINANTGWVWGGISGFAASILKTTNGGTSWVSQPNNVAYNLIILAGDMADINNGYCISGNKIFRTSNSGAMWNLITPTPFANSLSLNKIVALSPTNIIVGGSYSDNTMINKVYKSINAGVTWDSVSIPTGSLTSTSSIFAMDWVDQYNGIVGGPAGYTAKTSNGGINWTVRNTGGSTVVGMDMSSKDTAFAVSDRNGLNQIFRIYDDVQNISMNVTMGIQGFWNGSSQISDTAKCYLRSSASPYAIVDSAKGVLGTWGYATFLFNTAPTGSYYLQVGQRNSLETWSANTISFVRGGVTNDYDFTTAANKAFGNNMVLKSGRYCNYSGDVNQDGDVNLADVLETYNASSNFASGYVQADVNGNNFVDLSDITLVYNNAAAFVVKVTP